MQLKSAALLSLSPDYHEIGRQAARMVKKIEGGSAVHATPHEEPDHPLLAVNRRTAASLNLTVSSASIEAADRIVE